MSTLFTACLGVGTARFLYSLCPLPFSECENMKAIFAAILHDQQEQWQLRKFYYEKYLFHNKMVSLSILSSDSKM